MDDPERFITTIAAVLSAYPPHCIDQVADPCRGIQTRSKFVPTAAEIREACEEAMAPLRREQERERVLAAQQRRMEEDTRPRERLTAEQIRERYGENYGLNGDDLRHDAEARARYRARLQSGNRAVFAAECRAAGIDPATATVSPSLARLLGKPLQQEGSA